MMISPSMTDNFAEFEAQRRNMLKAISSIINGKKHALQSQYGNLTVRYSRIADNFNFDFEANVFDEGQKRYHKAYGQSEADAIELLASSLEIR